MAAVVMPMLQHNGQLANSENQFNSIAEDLPDSDENKSNNNNKSEFKTVTLDKPNTMLHNKEQQPLAPGEITAEAQTYLDNLLTNGCNEGDSGAELKLPDYYDEQLFLKGQKAMSKYRFVLCSGMLSGLVAVLAIPSILKILMCTRQSSTACCAYQRYIRTMLHTIAWHDYSISDRGSKFWTSIRSVRKAHTRSSSACNRMGAGRITQKDLALTQFGFIGFLTLGAHRINLQDDEFLEATAHMWRVVGYLLGLKDEYNACGRNWAETQQRLNIIRKQVYVPALENTGEDFERMTKALLGGLWPFNNLLTVGSFLYFTKRLAYVKGYEFYDFDAEPGTEIDPQHTRYHKQLSWWDRFIVTYGLFMVTYMHQYSIVRWYLNFRLWLNFKIIYYLPYLAFWKFGFKQAYVRIFTKSGEGKEFEFHLKEN